MEHVLRNTSKYAKIFFEASSLIYNLITIEINKANKFSQFNSTTIHSIR